MKIETLRLVDSESEGYAIRIDGELIFEYFTQYDAREDSCLDRGHKDVLNLGEIIKDAYWTGVLTDGGRQATLDQRKTASWEEYLEFTTRD